MRFIVIPITVRDLTQPYHTSPYTNTKKQSDKTKTPSKRTIRFRQQVFSIRKEKCFWIWPWDQKMSTPVELCGDALFCCLVVCITCCVLLTVGSALRRKFLSTWVFYCDFLHRTRHNILKIVLPLIVMCPTLLYTLVKKTWALIRVQFSHALGITLWHIVYSPTVVQFMSQSSVDQGLFINLCYHGNHSWCLKTCSNFLPKLQLCWAWEESKLHTIMILKVYIYNNFCW